MINTSIFTSSLTSSQIVTCDSPFLSSSPSDQFFLSPTSSPLKRRGHYKCGRCGQMKRGHQCYDSPSTSFPSSPSRSSSPYAVPYEQPADYESLKTHNDALRLQLQEVTAQLLASRLEAENLKERLLLNECVSFIPPPLESAVEFQPTPTIHSYENHFVSYWKL
eukprot:TRINITY_DN22821_c0_g1_i1.p1 TRINITY_DN22821_c0_g1~~TRINITY_DN22821_c0_g1_i1.p1  ORF type:complete len:164 (+),score=31.98 TRINITY_DN22821_c0_g1_i1:1-492(+)